MIASLKILFKTRDAFDFLDEQYEDDLETNCSLIFGLFGAINGLNSFFKNVFQFKEYSDSGYLFILLIISIAFGAVFGVLIGKYLTTYVLYWMSKLFKSSPVVIDLRVVAAYSLIPTLFYLPFILYLGISGWDKVSPDQYWIFDLVSAMIWIWVLKIMIQGVMRFSNLSFIKAFIAISPIILLGLIKFIMRYL